MNIIERPFNGNCSSRGGQPIKGICLHIAQTANGGIQALHNWAVSPNNGGSWHYGVAKDGGVYHYVPNEFAAWTQGLSWRNGVPYNPQGKLLDIPRLGQIIQDNKNINPNAYLIGVEHEGNTSEPWKEAMYKADAELIKFCSGKYGFPIDRYHVIGHYEIDYIDRASCPGTGLNWNTLFQYLNQPLPEADYQLEKRGNDLYMVKITAVYNGLCFYSRDGETFQLSNPINTTGGNFGDRLIVQGMNPSIYTIDWAYIKRTFDNRPISNNLYKVLKQGIQIGAYAERQNAFDKFVNEDADKATYNNNDITFEFKDEMNKLEQKINQLTSEKETCVKEKNDLIGEVNKLNDDVKKLNNDITTLKNTVRELENALENAEDCQPYKDQITEYEKKLQKPLYKIAEAIYKLLDKKDKTK